VKRSLVAVSVVGLLLLLAACRGAAKPTALPSEPGVTGVRQRQLVFARTTRSYRVFSPSAPAPGAGWPLVIVLGGVGDSAQSMTNATQFDREAAAGQFVVAYPESAGPSWNAGFCCAGAASDTSDDVGFLNVLLDQLQHDYRIDAARVYAVGVSAGAMMAYRWACADAERVTGVGSVAGAMLLDSCHPAQPVSIIEIHGTADPLVPYGGGTVAPPGVATQPVPSSGALAQRWATLDGCSETPSVQTATPVTSTTWSLCARGSGVRLIAVSGAGHTWYTPDFGAANGAVDATHEIWTYLSSHARSS
jgi:polyhydroxybutyrate depolymerase